MLTATLNVLRFLGAQFEGVVGSALPQFGTALLLVAVLSAVLIVAVNSIGAASPPLLAVGDRARAHAVLLAALPSSSHPDARGHARPRAPGVLLSVS